LVLLFYFYFSVLNEKGKLLRSFFLLQTYLKTDVLLIGHDKTNVQNHHFRIFSVFSNWSKFKVNKQNLIF